MAILSPFVYWAQNQNNVFLKVDLKDVKEAQVVVEKRKLKFRSKGSGAQGLNYYEFFLDFLTEIDETKNKVKITDNKVDIFLTKLDKRWWPRLTSHPQKPVWLKVDFDRWEMEDDVLDEDIRDIREEYPGLYEELQKQEIGYRKEDVRKVYLSLYNLFMFVGFLYVTVILCIKYLRYGPDFFLHTYETVGSFMCCLQLLQFLEVLHPIFGYVKGGAFMPFLQIFGRCFVLIFMIEDEPRIQKMPVVFYLFLVWCQIEIIRYPYYMSQLYKKEYAVLTWIRYSAWIVLYPLGFVCEGIIIFRNLIYVDQSNKWSVSLPNPLNFTFHFATFLRIYMLFLMIPGMYTLMSHMFKVRKQKLGNNRNKKIKKC